MVNVKISEKGGQQSNYEFDKPEVTIGRMKGNDIVLPKGNVSKKHARIYGRNGSLMIDDLNSTNGTYVNGRKVTSEHEITENDKVYIGDFILQIQPERQSGPPQAPPQPPGGGSNDPPPGGPSGTPNQSGGMSPPSPPDSGGGVGASSGGGPPAGGRGGNRNSGGGEALSSLDDKYGNSNDSAPSRQSGPAGDQGGPSQSQVGGNSSGRPSRPTPGSGGGRGGEDPRRNRSSTRRDQAVQTGGRDGGRPAGGDPSGGGNAGPSAGGGSTPPPGAGGERNANASGPGGSHTPAGGNDVSASGPDATNQPGTNAPAGSAPNPNPDRGPSVPSPSSPGGLGAGDSIASSASAEQSTVGPAVDEPRQRSDRLAQDLRGDRRSEGPVGQASLPADLESEFDERFHDAQQDVAEALLESIDFDELPLAYPPEEADSEDYREIVDEAVREAKPRRIDREVLTDLLVSECVGLGPLENYLDDPDVQNVYVNRWDRIVIRRDRDVVLAEHTFSHPAFLEAAAHRLLGTREPEVITDEIRFGDGTRVHMMMPPVTVDGPVMTVRKPPTSHPTLDDLVDEGVMSGGMRDFLDRAVETGRSILVAGPTSSGKTTLLETLGRSVPDGSRIVVVEETSQLELPQEGVVRLESRPATGFDLENVLDAAIGMHPERILLDECRGAEAYTWVSAAASGTEGSMATVHGINAADALGRLESLCLLGSGDISPRGLREQIARAVDLVVNINRANDGGFRIQQVTEVQGVDLDAFRLNDIFYYRMEGTSGAFHPTGYIPLFYEDLRHLGIDVDLDIFRE